MENPKTFIVELTNEQIKALPTITVVNPPMDDSFLIIDDSGKLIEVFICYDL